MDKWIMKTTFIFKTGQIDRTALVINDIVNKKPIELCFYFLFSFSYLFFFERRLYQNKTTNEDKK